MWLVFSLSRYRSQSEGARAGTKTPSKWPSRTVSNAVATPSAVVPDLIRVGIHAEFLCGSFDDISKYAADGRSAVDDGDLFAGRLFQQRFGYGKGRRMSGIALDDRFRFVGLRMILSVSR